MRNSTYSLITSALKPTMQEYTNPNKTHIAIGWDNIQETYRCCGLETNDKHKGFEDWTEAVGGIPLSCCEIPHARLNNFTCDSEQVTMHTVGCVQAFGDFIRSHALSLALVGVILAVIQLFGLLFACMIARQLKKNRGY